MTSKPLSLKELTKVQPKFNNVNEQNDALRKSTGMSIHELMAEAIGVERQKMLAGDDSKNYIKLLTTVFGKFSVGAPQHVITEDQSQALSRDEIKSRIDNYLTRMTLSTPSTNPEDPEEN